MHDLRDGALWLQLVGGLLLALLGALVLAVDPKRGANRAFALYAGGSGAGAIIAMAATLVFDEPALRPSAAQGALRIVANLAALGGLWGIAVAFPEPLPRGERRLVALPLLGSGAVFLASLPLAPDLPAVPRAMVWSVYPAVGLAASLPAFFALRALRAKTPEVGGRLALVAAAFLLLTGFASTAGSGMRVLSILGPLTWAPLSLALALTLLAALLWLRVASRGVAARAARNVALLACAMPLAGLLYTALDGDWGALGLARAGMVALLAYGIVRHQLLGIDVKVRWTISRSTVAAAFVAAFFLASEGAQLLFGQENRVVGLVAAGSLVFALAPLQRAAERLAEKAVPVTSAAEPAREEDAKADLYRRALRLALADRRLTHEEELTLAELSEHLRIGHRRALEIRHEVERDLSRKEDA